jgi:hypothetical protein
MPERAEGGEDPRGSEGRRASFARRGLDPAQPGGVAEPGEHPRAARRQAMRGTSGAQTRPPTRRSGARHDRARSASTAYSTFVLSIVLCQVVSMVLGHVVSMVLGRERPVRAEPRASYASRAASVLREPSCRVRCGPWRATTSIVAATEANRWLLGEPVPWQICPRQQRTEEHATGA